MWLGESSVLSCCSSSSIKLVSGDNQMVSEWRSHGVYTSEKEGHPSSQIEILQESLCTYMYIHIYIYINPNNALFWRQIKWRKITHKFAFFESPQMGHFNHPPPHPQACLPWEGWENIKEATTEKGRILKIIMIIMISMISILTYY